MPKIKGEPPLTLAALRQWIGEVEDKAWSAQRTAVGLRFLLGNLVLQLHRDKRIDAPAFMSGLLAGLRDLPEGFEQEAMRDLVQEVIDHLPAVGDGGVLPPGTVFH